jgi:hypothetical protein
MLMSSCCCLEQISGLTTASGVASALRKEFVSKGKLSGTQDTEFRAISDRTAGFGYSAPLTRGQPLVFSIGHVRDPYVQSIEKIPGGDAQGSMVQKWGYWRSKFSQTSDAISFFLQDYSKAIQAARDIDKKITEDAKRLGGDDYVAIVSLSARQALGALEITIGKDSAGNFNDSDVAAFLKEISSNGDMSVSASTCRSLFCWSTFSNPVMLSQIVTNSYLARLSMSFFVSLPISTFISLN